VRMAPAMRTGGLSTPSEICIICGLRYNGLIGSVTRNIYLCYKIPKQGTGVNGLVLQNSK
jgi:hypothetical protein